jgi:hypothetical protein
MEVNGMIIEMTKTELAVFDSLNEDGFDDIEILSEMINVFGVETRVINSRKIKTMIIGCVAS